MTVSDVQVVEWATGVLAEWNEAGVLAAADVHITDRLVTMCAEPVSETARLGAALAVRAVRLGSTCLALDRLGELAGDDTADLTIPSSDAVLDALLDNAVRVTPAGGAVGAAAGASPVVAAGSLKAIEIARGSDEARETLQRNTALFRELMTDAGFELLPGSHPITPVMFPGDDGARQAGEIAEAMLERGVYVIPFSFPVVPKGEARIRVQLSAAHSEEDVRACVQAFIDSREAVAGA